MGGGPIRNAGHSTGAAAGEFLGGGEAAVERAGRADLSAHEAKRREGRLKEPGGGEGRGDVDFDALIPASTALVALLRALRASVSASSPSLFWNDPCLRLRRPHGISCRRMLCVRLASLGHWHSRPPHGACVKGIQSRHTTACRPGWAVRYLLHGMEAK